MSPDDHGPQQLVQDVEVNFVHEKTPFRRAAPVKVAPRDTASRIAAGRVSRFPVFTGASGISGRCRPASTGEPAVMGGFDLPATW